MEADRELPSLDPDLCDDGFLHDGTDAHHAGAGDPEVGEQGRQASPAAVPDKKSALEESYRLHYRFVLNRFLRQTNNLENSLDLTQMVFLRLSQQEYKPGFGCKTWLVLISRSVFDCWINLHYQYHEQGGVELDSPSYRPNAHDALETHESNIEREREALGSLPEHYRPLVKSLMLGMSVPEISRHLKIPIDRVKLSMNRIRKAHAA